MAPAPKLPPGVRRLFRLPWTRDRMAGQVDDEVRFHLEMRAAEFRARGLSASEAEAAALRQFGDLAELRAYCIALGARRAQASQARQWLDQLRQDLYLAGRQFRRSPSVTAIAVLTLALGIGANTAIFTVVERVLLAPLPYPQGNRIVMITMDNRRFDVPVAPVLDAWQARTRTLERLAGVAIDAIATADTAEQDSIHAFITASYLPMLEVRPALGRAFTPQDEARGAPRVALISYGLWQSGYAGRPSVVGSTLHVGTLPYTIVGVMPRGLGVPMQQQGFRMHLHEALPGAWLPAPIDSMGDADLYARLRPGVSTREAARELEDIARSVPGAHSEMHIGVVRARDLVDSREASTIHVLFVAVGALLLIACANVASLLMSRAWARRREFAVRVALGAGSGRLTRQVLTESVLLALVGGAVGVFVAWEALRVIIALRPSALENLARVGMEPGALLWCAGLSLATGLLFGCAPALLVGARAIAEVLRNETVTASGGVAGRRVRSGLIACEVALSLVLLVGAGLLVRSFVALERMHLGFDPHGLVSIDVLVPHVGGKRMTAQQVGALWTAIQVRFRAIPGVADAALGTLPGDPWGVGAPLETDADVSGPPRSVPAYSMTFITRNYFRLARMSLVAGRLPEDRLPGNSPDTGHAAAPTEIVVNRGLALRFWPEGHAIGAHLHGDGPQGPGDLVVGIVDDIHLPGPQADIKAAALYRMPDFRIDQATFVVRTTLPGGETVAALRRAVSAVEPRILVRTVTIGDAYLRDHLAPTRFAMALLAAFAVLALLLSAIGLYGVVSYAVSQRTREIGVRIALGARPAAVTGLVMEAGLRMVAAGVVIGSAAALASTRVLSSLLYGVSPVDPLTFIFIVVLIAAIALLASYVPARRALRIDPSEALRAE